MIHWKKKNLNFKEIIFLLVVKEIISDIRKYEIISPKLIR